MKAQVLVLLAFLGIAQAQILPPEEHPSLLFTAQDIPLLRERTERQPYASWWKTVEQRALTQPSVNDDERAKVRQAKSLAFVYVITGDETRAREAAELLEIDLADRVVRPLLPAVKIGAPMPQRQRPRLGAGGGACFAQALMLNTSITNLNLKDNDLGAEGGKAIAEALEVNTSITNIA